MTQLASRRILALDPYHGGSHAAMLTGWRAHSAHRFTILPLPPHHWKWRLRHGAYTLAERARQTWIDDGPFDALFTTDMLDLAAWRGLVGAPLDRLPAVLYLHENQLLYPDARARERDHHFAFTNLLAIAAADATWFNSGWHRDALTAAAENWLRRMPDHVPGSLIAAIRAATVQHPGCDLPPPAPPSIGPCRLLWAARWEADKDPATFFAAIDQLEASDADYRLLVVGGGGEQAHPAFAAARRRLAHRIEVWGHQADREAYRRVLATADVVVSTARHEFFGLAVVEAVAAGCYPLVPDDLAYGEVLAGLDADMFHDRTVTDIATRLQDLCHHHSCGSLWHDDPARGQRAVQRYDWSQRAPAMDTAMEAVIAQHQSPAHPPR